MIEQSLVSELIVFASAGKHTKFKLLQNRQEYLFMREVRATLKFFIKQLQVAADKHFKSYCKAITLGTAEVYKLLAYKDIIDILNFYVEELVITENMLSEYISYLAAGNLLDFIFNQQRPAAKQYDHRGG